MGLGSAIGGAIGLGGSALSAKWARAEAERNRKFQMKMSSTAYQRGMKDMRKAGLNPILAYKQGPAATAAGSQGLMPDAGKNITAGMDAGTRSNTGKEQRRNLAANTDQSREQANRLRSLQGVDAATQLKSAQETLTSAANQKFIENQNLVLGTKIPRARAMQAFDESVGAPLLEQLQSYINSAKSWKSAAPTTPTYPTSQQYYGEPEWSQ